MTDFVPTAITVRDTKQGPAILAVDMATGDQAGNVVPRQLMGLLANIVAESHDALVTAWHQYHRNRGGEVLFWDLVKLCQAITVFDPPTELMPLTRFPTADSIFHNAQQAQSMLVAQREGLAPILVPTHPASRTPDIKLRARDNQGVEIKTVQKLFTAELYPEGVRMTSDEIAKLCDNLEEKTRSAYEQSNIDGAVVLAVWCDVAGLFIEAATQTSLAGSVTFDSRSVTLAFCDRQGSDKFAVFSRDNYGVFLAELKNIMMRIVVPRHINLTRHVSIVRSGQVPHFLPSGRRLRLYPRS